MSEESEHSHQMDIDNDHDYSLLVGDTTLLESLTINSVEEEEVQTGGSELNNSNEQGVPNPVLSNVPNKDPNRS